MNKLETLIAQYPQLNFIFTHNMPFGLSGLCVDNEIYINLNRNKTTSEQYVTISEEISHNETGTGNIIEQKTVTDRKQEQLARKLGCLRIVSLDCLIKCYEKGINTIWDIAEELEVTTECVEDAFHNIRITKGLYFYYKNYSVKFITDSHLIIEKIA